MSRLFVAITAGAVLLVAGVGGASGTPRSSDAPVPRHVQQRGLVRLDGSPSTPAIDVRTHTLYVPIQCDHVNSCPGKPTGRVLDIVDTSRCQPGVASGCRVVGRAPAGDGPLDAVIDPKTDTIYVIDGSGAVTVLDGSRCNASVRTHCRPLATIKTGGFDVAGALNPRTQTLYVAAPSGEVFVVNVAGCNSRTTRGCHQHVRTVKDPRGPDAVDIDLATNTVYVADGGQNSPGHTVSVINGATCNGSVGRGCQRRPRRVGVGASPYWLTVDQATDTVYVANHDDLTVSVINGAKCNRTVTSGCSGHPRAVFTGAGGSFVAVDRSRHTLFALNEGDGTMSEINTKTCNGRRQSGCPSRARNARVPFNPPTGGNPNELALLPSAGIAYVVNSGGERFLAAINVKHCTALTTAGCRKEPPTVPLNAGFQELDTATNTIYAASHHKSSILVLDATRCNASQQTGCKPVATIPFPHPQANLGSIDDTTHTLYAADTFSNKLLAVDIKHCTATDTSGCRAAAPKITVGPGPNAPVLDRSTHTLYVTAGKQENLIYVIDAATCNAQVSSGCTQSPATITVAPNSYYLDVSSVTDTIYTVGVNWPDHQVWVVNGASCNAGDHSGCGHAVAAKANVGLDPLGVTVDDSTGTVYAPNNADGDLPGTVSVINSATCNGSVTTSCASGKPKITVGRSPVQVAVDTHTNRVYVSDFSSAAVSSFDGSHCEASDASGCGTPAREHTTGSQPGGLLVDHKQRTVYVRVGAPGNDGLWSIFPTSPR